MSTIVPENYSILNCYIHDDKSNVLIGCDFLSAPIRSVFGGRDITLTYITEQGRPSVFTRVMIVFAAAAIYYIYSPLLLVPLVALSLKYTISLFNEGEIKIKNSIAKIIDLTSNKTPIESPYGANTDLLEFLGPNFFTSCENYLRALIFCKICEKHSLDQIVNDITELQDLAGIPELLSSAIDIHIKSDDFLTSDLQTSDGVCNFFEKSCACRGTMCLLESYEKLLQSALLLDGTDIMKNSYKMYLVSLVIRKLEVIKAVNYNRHTFIIDGSMIVKHIDKILEGKIFIPKNQESDLFNKMFDKKDQISHIVHNFVLKKSSSQEAEENLSNLLKD